MTTRQGRCHPCGVRYVWAFTADRPLKKAWCPECGVALQRTNHLFQGPVVRSDDLGPYYRGRKLPTFTYSHVWARKFARNPRPLQ